MGYSVFAMNVDANRACGRCLSRLRGERGLTQVELSRKLGVHQSFVSKVETGERSLKAYELFGYAEALGIDVHTLLDQLETSLASMECGHG